MKVHQDQTAFGGCEGSGWRRTDPITHRESEVPMKRPGVWTVLLILVVVLIVWIAYAQRNPGRHRMMPHYDTSTEVTAKGVIESVDSETGRIGWNGTHLVVKFDSETLPVHVGPSDTWSKMAFHSLKVIRLRSSARKCRLKAIMSSLRERPEKETSC